ncbi:MAG: hypothetical protein M3540_10875, partial [Actinomycetota bacterium]|nr:hypothetical protein [Actinomycetota bacterium]
SSLPPPPPDSSPPVPDSKTIQSLLVMPTSIVGGTGSNVPQGGFDETQLYRQATSRQTLLEKTGKT